MCVEGNITIGNVILKEVCDIFTFTGNIRELLDADKVRLNFFLIKLCHCSSLNKASHINIKFRSDKSKVKLSITKAR